MEVITLSPREKDRRLTQGWLDEIIGRDSAALGKWRTGKVCQMCGDVAVVRTFQEWVAAHVEGGEFKGFRAEHAACDVPPGGALADRPYRFCEVCQEQVRRESDRRVGLSWICEGCEGTARRSGHSLAAVLRELGRRRSEHYESHPVLGPRPDEGDLVSTLGKRLPPPEGWLPPGLFRCERCETIRGTTWGPKHDGGVGPWKSTCLCEGIVCRRCGKGRIRRPISDYYSPKDGYFWHVPYFMGMAGCSRCPPKR